MYLLQKSLHNSWTFSSSNKCIRNTWIAFIIWKKLFNFIKLRIVLEINIDTYESYFY